MDGAASIGENKLTIGAVWYPVTVLGFGNRLGIWFQGCSRNCQNCISPEFKDYNAGHVLSVEELNEMLVRVEAIDGLTISGGEPFDQPEALFRLITWFESKYNDDVLLFTGYTLEQLQKRNNPIIEAILNHISVLIDGEYKDDMHSEVGLMGSYNQRIHVWKYRERYDSAEKLNREMQCVLLRDRIWMIGVPM